MMGSISARSVDTAPGAIIAAVASVNVRLTRRKTLMYQYKTAVDRGTFIQPRCLARTIPGKSWAGALITDEDPEDRWYRALRAHKALIEVLRDLERDRWSRI